MVLTTSQQYKIMLYLGFPLKALDATSEFYSPIILSRVQNFDPNAEPIVVDMLAKLDDVYTRLMDAETRMLALGIEGIQLNPEEFKLLQRAKKFWVTKLSQVTQLPVAEYGEATSATARVQYV